MYGCIQIFYTIDYSLSVYETRAWHKVKVNAGQACSQVGAAESDPVLTKVSDFKDACWRFMRPHTVHGTVLGST